MQSLYDKNMEALKKRVPDLAKWIEKEPNANWCTLVHNSNNSPNLLIQEGAKNSLAYDVKNPRKQAKDIIKNKLFEKDEVTIVFGLGIGHLTKQILLKKEKTHRVIVVEPIASMYNFAFQFNDFSKEINQGTLIFASPGEKELTYIVTLLETTAVIQGWQVLINGYIHKRPDEYFKLFSHTISTINQVKCNTGTVVGAGKTIADNDINSLPYVIRHRGVSELKNLFKDKPAILVCTGPSLEKNIHELIPIQDKVIIIAVAQALRILLAYDIRPDFITTVDFGETNLGHYKGLMDSNVPLVCLNRTYAKILKNYQGPKFVVATPVPGHEHTSAGILSEKGFLDGGGSVAHLSLMFGYFMGCNPLIIIGQDLALTDNKSHFNQADESGVVKIEQGEIAWEVKDHRSHLVTKRKKKKEEPTYSMGSPIPVPGYFGLQVFTNSGLLSFILAFKNIIEAYFSKSKDRIVIDATEGGARIEGTKRYTLKKSIEKYCKEDIDKSILIPLLSYANNADELIEKVIPLLEKDIAILDCIITESKLALVASAKMKKNLNNGYMLTKFMKENEKHSLAAQSAATKNPLVTVAIFNASRMIQNRDLKVKGRIHHLIHCKKDLQIRIKRNRLILMAAKEAALNLKKGYKEALSLLKKYNETKDESILQSHEDIEPSIKDAFDFFKRGNFARPLLEARKILKNDKNKIHKVQELFQAKKIESIAIKLRNKSIQKAILKKKQFDADKLLEYLDLMEENNKLGKEQLKKEKPDFTKANKLLEKAVELFPNKESSLWGYATTLHHMEKFDESIKQYKHLIEIMENNLKKIYFSKRSQEFLEKYKKKLSEKKDYKEEENILKVAKLIKLQKKELSYNDIKKRLLIYQYELGQVKLISGKVYEGLKDIKKVMEQTNSFNSFFQRIGDIYFDLGDIDKALLAYDSYLENFPHDYKVWGKKGDCHQYLNEDIKSKRAYLKLTRLKPDEKEKLSKGFYHHKRKENKLISA